MLDLIRNVGLPNDSIAIANVRKQLGDHTPVRASLDLVVVPRGADALLQQGGGPTAVVLGIPAGLLSSHESFAFVQYRLPQAATGALRRIFAR